MRLVGPLLRKLVLVKDCFAVCENFYFVVSEYVCGIKFGNLKDLVCIYKFRLDAMYLKE